jgi:TRAP transporter TAXI family solute receptor
LNNLRSISLSVAACGAIFAAGSAMAQSKFVTIGTGGITGVYYAAGGAVCRLVNRARATNGIRCSVESTPGSLVNLDSLKRNSLNFAVVQADLQYQAVKGEGAFAKSGAQTDLRGVFSLYPEAVVVLAKKDTDIKTLDDMKGLRFSVGMLGSGGRATMEKLLQFSNWKPGDFGSAVEKTADEQGYALCENKIDGFAYVVGNPSPNVLRTMKECRAKLVPVDGPSVAAFLKESPYFVKTEIAAGVYPDQANAVATVGMLASLVTIASTPDEMVYSVVKAAFENLEELKTLHPTLSRLDPKKMVTEGLAAPLHPGALRYYKEKGWL